MTDASQELFAKCLINAMKGDKDCIGREHSISCIEQAVESTLNFLKACGVPIDALEHGRMEYYPHNDGCQYAIVPDSATEGVGE